MKQWEIQKAVFNKLDTDLIVPIYDHVPQDSGFPYVAIGDDTSLEWDTDTSLGSNSTLTIHVWSRQHGRREIKDIMKSIYNSLHRAALVVDEAEFVMCDWEFAESFVDPDGVTRHGVMRFRFLLDEEQVATEAVTFGGDAVTFGGEGVTYA